MDQLPVELKLKIFFALSELPSLVTLSQTSSSLYRIFTKSQSQIVTTVLSNEIHPDVFPHALAVWKASCIKPWSKSGVKAFLEQYPESLKQPPRSKQTLSEASTICKLHGHVQFFTEDLCAAILSVHPISQVPENTYTPPSKNELCRIQIAFYKFELFCTLFRAQHVTQRDQERFSTDEQHHLFFEHFKPWENEQLACMFDYLLRKLSLPFDDMAEHDVCWGGSMLDTSYAWPRDAGKEGYLSKGLGFLHRLCMAKSYEEWAAVFGNKACSDHLFLAAGLSEQVSDDELERHRQSAIELQAVAISELSVADDSGPVEA